MPKSASAYYIMKRRLCIQFLSVALQDKAAERKVKNYTVFTQKHVGLYVKVKCVINKSE